MSMHLVHGLEQGHILTQQGAHSPEQCRVQP